MAKHEITIRENTGATKAVAPYLGTYVSKETVKIDPISEAVAKLCGLPSIQVQTILTGAFDQIARMQQEDGAVRCNFDGFAVYQVIKGLFPSSDAAFDPAVNTLELAILLNDDVRNHLVNVVPAIVADDTATKVRVHNVADVEMPRPYQVIHGKHPFCVTGINLVMSDEGAEVYLEDSKGIKFACVVDEVKSKQEFTAHSDALLDGGDYKCWVKSRGGDTEGTLQCDFRKVKYLRIVDPPPPKATATLHPTAIAALAGVDPFTEINRGTGGFYFHSDGHEFAEGETVTFTLEAEGLDEPDVRECTVAMVDGAPRVYNPFGDPIHASLEGTVTYGNDAVKGEVAYVPEE